MGIDLGTRVVIVSAGQVLLIKREDVEMWSLPGGGVESGESLAQAAIREAHEETGLDVQLTRFVGLYSQPTRNNHVAVFEANPIGGTLHPQDGEVLEVRYFSLDSLPSPFLWWHRRPLQDSLSGVGGSAVWTQQVTWSGAEFPNRREIYAMRDASGLSRSDFFDRYLGQKGSNEERREL